MRMILPALGLGLLAACSPAIPDSGAGVGFDTDQELLQIINEGTISDTRIGRYLQNLKGRLEPTVVADMLCLIRLHLELSIQATHD